MLPFGNFFEKVEPSAGIELMLGDNSPVMCPPLEGFSGIYLSDPSNPEIGQTL